MKNTVKLITLTILFINSISFIGCSKDDDGEITTGNQFVFDGEIIKTPSGYTLFKDSDNSSEIGLFTKNLTFDIIKNGGSTHGSAVLINNIPTTTKGQLTEGTYSIGNEKATIVINANFNSEQDVFSKRNKITSGTIIVSKSNNTYTIDYNLQFNQNKTAVGTYTGILESK